MDDIKAEAEFEAPPSIDWERIARCLLLARALEEAQANALAGSRTAPPAYPAAGHDFAQVVLGTMLSHRHDAASGYYRSLPLALALGASGEDALGAALGRAGGFSNGRDLGFMPNMPGNGVEGPACSLLPVSANLGAQFTPAAGWARAIAYHRDVLHQPEWNGAIAVALGGESSVSSNGFWAALNLATTHNLPYLFFIEDNGYGSSMPSNLQTPGGDMHDNLRGWKNLKIVDGDGCDPLVTPQLIADAVAHVRAGQGACLIQLSVPRLGGHTSDDDQNYKPRELVKSEAERDPLQSLKQYLAKSRLVAETSLRMMRDQITKEVNELLRRAEERPQPDPAELSTFSFASSEDPPPLMGGIPAEQGLPPLSPEPTASGERIDIATAIGKTLDSEMQTNPRLVAFGEDVEALGGSAGAASELTAKHGAARAFNFNSSKEALLGSAAGMALAGLLPVPEVAARKYLHSASEIMHDIGTMRWRTANRFAAPMVVRVPVGHGRHGDPWESASEEAEWAHKIGWQIAMPSNANDAAGLLRQALRSGQPTLFLEHRSLYHDHRAREKYPGDNYALPFGKASVVTPGNKLTLVTWGAMLHRAVEALKGPEHRSLVEIIDLRTIQPWDQDTVIQSVSRTGRCLIVHEDNLTAGFGAEIAAHIADKAFWKLDAPIKRLAMPDIPMPYNPALAEAALPSVSAIREAADELAAI